MSALPPKADVDQRSVNVRLVLPAQPVDATQALNFSAGVSNPRVLRGRSLSWRATLLRWACEYTDKSAPFENTCSAGHWCSRWNRAGLGFSERKRKPRCWLLT